MKTENLSADQEERAVVGCCLSFPGGVGAVTCEPSDFSDHRLKDALEVAMKIHADGTQPTPSNVARDMSLGGSFTDRLQFLILVAGEASTPMMVEHQCNIVRNRHARRLAISAATRLTALVMAGEDAEAALAASDAVSALCGIGQGKSGPVSLGAAAEIAFSIGENARKSGVSPGIPIKSLPSLSAVFGGLRKKRHYIIGGRPGHGKSALMMQICVDAAESGAEVLVFSLEMAAESLAVRQLARKSGIPSQRIDRGEYKEGGVAALASAVDELSQLPLHIDDRAALTIQQIEQTCRAHKARRGRLDVIAVDYVQLARSGDKRATGEENLSKIVKGIDALKKTFDCAVVALAQPNRGCDHRMDRRPMMADLHGTSEFEKTAEVLMFVYREAAYKDRPDADPHAAEIIISKNRSGTTPTILLSWDGRAQTFG